MGIGMSIRRGSRDIAATIVLASVSFSSLRLLLESLDLDFPGWGDLRIGQRPAKILDLFGTCLRDGQMF